MQTSSPLVVEPLAARINSLKAKLQLVDKIAFPAVHHATHPIVPVRLDQEDEDHSVSIRIGCDSFERLEVILGVACLAAAAVLAIFADGKISITFLSVAQILLVLSFRTTLRSSPKPAVALVKRSEAASGVQTGDDENSSADMNERFITFVSDVFVEGCRKSPEPEVCGGTKPTLLPVDEINYFRALVHQLAEEEALSRLQIVMDCFANFPYGVRQGEEQPRAIDHRSENDFNPSAELPLTLAEGSAVLATEETVAVQRFRHDPYSHTGIVYCGADGLPQEDHHASAAILIPDVFTDAEVHEADVGDASVGPDMEVQPISFIPCPNFDHDPLPLPPRAPRIALKWTCQPCGRLNKAEKDHCTTCGADGLYCGEGVHRVFFGQLRKKHTVEFLAWTIRSVFPSMRVAHIEPHTVGKGRSGSTGCAWVYVYSATDVVKLHQLHRNVFCDVNDETVPAVDAGSNDTTLAMTYLAPGTEGIWVDWNAFSHPSLDDLSRVPHETPLFQYAKTQGRRSHRPQSLLPSWPITCERQKKRGGEQSKEQQ